jgi:hypothetical protein
MLGMTSFLYYARLKLADMADDVGDQATLQTTHSYTWIVWREMDFQDFPYPYIILIESGLLYYLFPNYFHIFYSTEGNLWRNI